jgi:hypothetical protein
MNILVPPPIHDDMAVMLSRRYITDELKRHVVMDDKGRWTIREDGRTGRSKD